MTAIATIGLTFMGGDDIEDACAEACRIARLLGCRTNFAFNGVEVFARPDTNPAALAEAWDAALRSKREFKMAHA